MIERAVEITPDQGEVTFSQCLEQVKTDVGLLDGRLGYTYLRGSVRKFVGLANHAVISIFEDTKKLGVINGSAFSGNSRVFSREEALTFTAICWTIKDGFKQTQPRPFEDNWGQIIDQTRTNLADERVLGSLLSEPADPDAQFSTGDYSYADFTIGRDRSPKWGEKSDRFITKRPLSAAEVFSETRKWDKERLEILHDSLQGSVDQVQLNSLPEFIAERIVRIAERAAQRPSRREIDDIEEAFFKNDVMVCIQLMELLRVNDLIGLEAAVRRMAASGGRTEDLRITTN